MCLRSLDFEKLTAWNILNKFWENDTWKQLQVP